MEAQHGQGGKQPERKMELEVSKKIREAIKAKLLELGSHIDEELPDYVMILIANRRTVPQMETDLSLFLGDSAKKFVSWLTHVLKKLDRVTSVPGQKSEDDGAGTGSTSKSKSKKASKGKKSGKPDGSGSSSKAEARSARKIAKRRRSKHSETSVTTSRVETSSVVTSSTEDLPSCTISSTKSSSESLRRLRSKSKDSNEKGEDKDAKPDSSKGESSKENVTAPRFKLTMKQQTPRDKKPKKRSALDLDDEHEDEGRSRPRLTLLSDDEHSPLKNAPSKADDDQERDSTHLEESTAQKERVSQLGNSQKEDVQSQSASDLQTVNEVVSEVPDEPDTHIDTLILNTEENEFADNVEELRRIALESQDRKRRDKGTHQKKLITGILMSNKDSFKDKTDKRVTRSSVHESRSSKVDNSPRISSLGRRDSKESRPTRCETPPRTVRSPRKSVFDRLSKNSKRESNRDMNSRSRSRSPVRKLTSTIGNVINRSTSVEEVTVRPSVNSVVRVTDRPKRDLKMNNKLLLLAVQDAQKSIIQTEQRSSKVEDKTRLHGKRSNEENRETNDVYRNKDKSVKSRLQFRDRESSRGKDLKERASLKRFHEFPEVNTEEFFEPTDAESRRKSIKERLGVRRERRPVKDRLGVVQNAGTPEKEETTTDQYVFNDDDFNIVINVNGSVEQRNVTLEASAQAELDNKQLNRISIRVNDSEEEDSSDDDYESSENENGRSAKEKSSSNRSAKRDSGSVDGDEVVCVVNDDDRLPDPESDVEYIVEEIEIEEGSDASDEARTEIIEPVSILDMSPKIELRTTERSDNASSSEDSQLTVRIGELAQNNFPSYPQAVPMRETNEYRPVFVPTVSRPLPQGTSQSQSQCKFWPNCQFKDNCIYEHPKCKFNPCTKTQCVYKHSNPIVHKPLPESPSKKKVCKFYPKCTSMSCKFFHPSPCRFGVGCTAAGCQNFHPGVTIGMQSMRAKGKTVIPKVNELKWVKK